VKNNRMKQRPRFVSTVLSTSGDSDSNTLNSVLAPKCGFIVKKLINTHCIHYLVMLFRYKMAGEGGRVACYQKTKPNHLLVLQV
jgi:hypothetical protein